MKKINFRNDYCGIAHKDILQALIENENNSYVGYGLDEQSEQAKKLIQKELKNENVDIHFIPGGTLTNKVLISHVLRPYEAVISADSGHINVHETGTIEQSGHKILTAPNNNGKINGSDIISIYNSHTDEHMVKPKMVYISNPTEFGTIYTKEELTEISNICKKLDLYLYMDGARLGCALTSPKNDLVMSDLSNLVDAFYIGGTKNGLLLGEALVVINEELKPFMRHSVKHFGGMYAKGFINGIQFKTLFENNLFYNIAKKQNDLAMILYNKMCLLGIKFLMEQETNQIFPVFKNETVEKLKDYFLFEIWERKEEETVIRFVTNYLLNEDDVNNAIEIIKNLI